MSMNKKLAVLLVVLSFSLLLMARGAEIRESELTPFVLPWDDLAAGPTNVIFLNHSPAGKHGWIHAGQDGHLYAGEQRIRFFGVNVCFGGAFPDKDQAASIAGRLAKFGINAVRFHHIDRYEYPAGLIKTGTMNHELDPRSLERLDQFIADLKDRGIYTNLNLLVSRQFKASDGLPAEIEKLDWKVQHAVGMYHPRMIDLQKEYALALLGHRNARTGLTYGEDPAVAFVEIINENGLIHHWLENQLDSLPEPFAKALAELWNVWLKQRYADTAALNKSWKNREEPFGPELLSPVDIPSTKEQPGWSFEKQGTVQASLRIYRQMPGRPATVHILVNQGSEQSWHLQFNHAGLKLKAGQMYTLMFRTRADRDRDIKVQVGQAHEPWHHLGLDIRIRITTEWKEHTLTFIAKEDEDNARVNFSDLAQGGARIGFTHTSLRTGGFIGLTKEENLEQRQVPLILYRDPRPWSESARTDFVRFLWDTERHYYDTMRRFIRDELKYQGMMIGSIVGCSTPGLQAEFDAVDGHGYWQHPQFPGKPWDREDWTVKNTSMVNEPGGVPARLAMQRVAGKPFTVTEYNHAAPNTYASEAPLLLASHAALQDWDAVFIFAYSHSGQWDSARISSFFDIDQHPTKLVHLPAAAMMFRGGHVSPAKQEMTVDLDVRREPELILRHGHSWRLLDMGYLGAEPTVSLLHRTALRLLPIAGIPFSRPISSESRPSTKTADEKPAYISDTGEITWDHARMAKGFVTINTARTKAVIGFVDGQSFDLGGITIAPGPTMQNWCVICLTLIEGESWTRPGRALITATGYAQNTGMKWKDETHTSVGSQWGRSPSLVEVIPATLTLPLPPAEIDVWALNQLGQRESRLTPRAGGGNASIIDLGSTRTLWYEMVIKTP